MSHYYDKQKKRWRFRFVRRIHGKRYRASKLLPSGWSRVQVETFDRTETARLYALATGTERRQALVNEAIELYKRHRLSQQRGGHKAERHLAAIQTYYDGRGLDELPEIARKYAEDQRGTLSADTIRNRLAYLKAACRYAWKHHGLTDADPTARMAIPSPGAGRQVYLTVPQLNRLLRHFDDPEAAAVARIAFYTGLRWISELLPRQPGDVRANRGQAWLLAGTTKNGTPRMVPVHPAIRSSLRYLPFTRHWRDYYAAFERAKKAAGLPSLRMHDLRHSLASEIISRGGTLSDVQGALHHTSVVSARRYAHLYPGRLRSIMLKVGGRGRKSSHRRPEKQAAKQRKAA
jgi:integrase